MAKTVTVIPSTINPYTHISLDALKKKKVAAYARVSTDHEEQTSSYNAQVDYYEKTIKNNPDWEFVKVYADDGISGTSTKKREGFNKMINDALDGKIDIIITKSISRFARNTVDTLSTIRKLKEKGIDVFFEKENVHSLDSAGELMLTILSSLAQEESRSISSNVTWGKRKSFQDGNVYLPYAQFLGYDKGEDGLPKINEKQAKLVREIYAYFLSGKSPSSIARILMERKIPTPAGKEKWTYTTITSILSNEKYKGSARLQKKYTVDFLTKKQVVNKGEVPQYYVENSHPAIVDPDEWELVQQEIERRKNLPFKIYDSPLSARLICGDCGCSYGPKVWHSTDKYRKVIWRCNNKYKDKNQKCSTGFVEEEKVKKLYLEAFSEIMEIKDSVIEDIELVIKELMDVDYKNQMQDIKDEMHQVSELVDKHIQDNARKESDIKEYMNHYVELAKRYNSLQSDLDKLIRFQVDRDLRAIELRAFIKELKIAPSINLAFDDRLFNLTIEKCVVNKDKTITFHFKNGTEIKKALD